MKVRQFATGDLDSILAIQNRCPQASRWSAQAYLRLVSDPGGAILVAELDTATTPKVLGFLAIHRIVDQAEVLNLAVDPDHQRQGAGRALFEEIRKRLLAEGTKRIYLEVRPSNKPALAFYYSLGFGLHSLRKDYYQQPLEDAFVMYLSLFTPETAQ